MTKRSDDVFKAGDFDTKVNEMQHNLNNAFDNLEHESLKEPSTVAVFFGEIKKAWPQIVGVLMCIAAVCLGLYVGLYVMFVGGIVSIVEAVQSTPIEAGGIAWGIVRMVLAVITGVIVFMVLFIPGVGLCGFESKSSSLEKLRRRQRRGKWLG